MLTDMGRHLPSWLRADLRPTPSRAPWLFGPRITAPALTVAALIYLAYFGPSALRGVWMLIDPWPRDHRWEARSGVFELAELLGRLGLLVVAIALALNWVGAAAALRLPRTRADIAAESWSVLAWFVPYLLFSQILTSTITSVTGSPGYPAALNNNWGLAFDVAGSLAAGVEEELLLGPLAITLLRRRGLSWPVVVIVVAIARTLFHLYYGWGAIGIALWGIGAAMAYAATGRIWGVVVLHAMNDLSLTLADIGISAGITSTGIYVALAVVIAGLDLWRRAEHRPEADLSEDQRSHLEQTLNDLMTAPVLAAAEAYAHGWRCVTVVHGPPETPQDEQLLHTLRLRLESLPETLGGSAGQLRRAQRLSRFSWKLRWRSPA